LAPAERPPFWLEQGRWEAALRASGCGWLGKPVLRGAGALTRLRGDLALSSCFPSGVVHVLLSKSLKTWRSTKRPLAWRSTCWRKSTRRIPTTRSECALGVQTGGQASPEHGRGDGVRGTRCCVTALVRSWLWEAGGLAAGCGLSRDRRSLAQG